MIQYVQSFVIQNQGEWSWDHLSQETKDEKGGEMTFEVKTFMSLCFRGQN